MPPESIGSFNACSVCNSRPSDQVNVAFLAAEKRLFDAVPLMEERATDAMKEIRVSMDAKDWFGNKDEGRLKRTLHSASNLVSEIRSLLAAEPRVASTHYYAAKLMKVLMLLLAELGDGYLDSGSEDLAQDCWTKAALKLHAAANSDESSFWQLSDARAQLLIKQGRVMRRLKKHADGLACYKEALRIVRATHWPCGESKLQGDEQNKLEFDLSRTIASIEASGLATTRKAAKKTFKKKKTFENLVMSR